MYSGAEQNTPKPGETLDSYIQRLRSGLHLSQQQLATRAGIHIQSMGKIERGQTQRLNQKTKTAKERQHCPYLLSIWMQCFVVNQYLQ